MNLQVVMVMRLPSASLMRLLSIAVYLVPGASDAVGLRGGVTADRRGDRRAGDGLSRGERGALDADDLLREARREAAARTGERGA